MQHEVDTATTVRPIELLGVNESGAETGNSLVTPGRTLPWLQDTPQAAVWNSWRVTYRDVVILDAQNRVIHVYNLTSNDLADPAKYAELKSLLLAAAR